MTRKDIVSSGALVFLLSLAIVVFGFSFATHETQHNDMLAVIGITLSTLTLLLVGSQIFIALLEVSLVEKQGKILDRQDRELGRRAKLRLWSTSGTPEGVAGSTFTLLLTMANAGNKTATAATIMLFVPHYVGVGGRDAAWTQRLGFYLIEGIQYNRFDLDLINGHIFQLYEQSLGPVSVNFFTPNGEPFPNGLYYRFAHADETPEEARKPFRLTEQPPDEWNEALEKAATTPQA